MAEDVVFALPANQFVRCVACQAIGAFVPVENPPFAIHKVDAIAHVVKQFFIKTRVCGIRRRSWLFRIHFRPLQSPNYAITHASSASKMRVRGEGYGACPFNPQASMR